MIDLKIAEAGLDGHTICLCKDGRCLFSDKRGIAPMLGFIAQGENLRGYSAADLIVGKAAALLFAKSGVVSVYAKVLSQGGKEVLQKFGVFFEYETLTDNIINRDGTDICPMEKTVANISDPDEAYIALTEKVRSLQANKNA